MKLLAFTADGLDADCLPESTLIRPATPLFYPEEGADWHLALWLAVRINRLGKSISRKFAPRYYDAVTVALRLDCHTSPTPGLLAVMDGSVATGEWVDIADAGEGIDVRHDGAVYTLAVDRDTIDEAIARASRLITLRMGDILLLPTLRSLPLAPRSRVELAPLLSLKVV